jgi:hypothetical protein
MGTGSKTRYQARGRSGCPSVVPAPTRREPRRRYLAIDPVKFRSVKRSLIHGSTNDDDRPAQAIVRTGQALAPIK